MPELYRNGDDVWKGAVAGLAGGLAGAYAMNQFQALVSRLGESWHEEPQRNEARGQAAQQQQEAGEREGNRQPREEDADATVKTARRISRTVLRHELTERQEEVAGPAVHFAFGALTGAFYGAMAEIQPEVALGAGLPFGIAVWAGADEIAVPAFGLSEPPLEHPPSVHAQAFAAHLVYGLTTDLVRRAVRRVL